MKCGCDSSIQLIKELEEKMEKLENFETRWKSFIRADICHRNSYNSSQGLTNPNFTNSFLG